MVMADDLPAHELAPREPTVEDLRNLCRELRTWRKICGCRRVRHPGRQLHSPDNGRGFNWSERV